MKTLDSASKADFRFEQWQKGCLAAQMMSTVYMVGVIWFVQVVHYPLFADVGVEQFPAWEQRNVVLTTWVVGPGMLVEAITAIGMFFLPGAMVSRRLAVTGTLLLAVIWASTHFLQVPCHNKLASGFDSKIHEMLVNSNWIRTLCWTLRGALMMALLNTATSQRS